MIRIACFATSAASHFSGVRSIAREFVRFGAEVCVWTDIKFTNALNHDGVTVQNLFQFGSVDEADNGTLPRAARFIAFSVQNFEPILRSVSAWKPDLILVEGFTLIGQLIAEEIGCPWVLLNGTHIPNGSNFRQLLSGEFPEFLDKAFLTASRTLNTRFGHRDVSLYSFVLDPSPYATIHFEPQQWPDYKNCGHCSVHYWGSAVANTFKDVKKQRYHPVKCSLYLSFGTIIWRNWFEETLAITKRIVDECLRSNWIDLSIGLGGYELDDKLVGTWRNHGVKVHNFADQHSELDIADIFITHHGMNSTHEAIRSRTPMLSIPFFGDQPRLAERSQKFGLAMPLVKGTALRNEIRYDALTSTINSVCDHYDDMQEAFDIAQTWDISAHANRTNIIQKIVNLI